MRRISRHYLQSNSWKHLRNHFHNELGFDESVSADGSLRLVGHISRERRRRSFLHNYVLEAFFGPYQISSGNSPIVSKETIDYIMAIALRLNTHLIRLHSYKDTDFAYVTLSEFSSILQEDKIPFIEHCSSTLIYNLLEHEFNSLDACSASVRKNLRKASEIKIVRASEPVQIAEFFRQLSLLKGKRAPRNREVEAYQNWREGCILFLAYDANYERCLGTLGFVHDNHLATEIASSTAKGVGARGVQEKLHLACFDQAKEIGLEKFDLAGLERNFDGEWNTISKFKLKFGGEITSNGFIEIDVQKS